jgi:hypothetical protein
MSSRDLVPKSPKFPGHWVRARDPGPAMSNPLSVRISRHFDPLNLGSAREYTKPIRERRMIIHKSHASCRCSNPVTLRKIATFTQQLKVANRIAASLRKRNDVIEAKLLSC